MKYLFLIVILIVSCGKLDSPKKEVDVTFFQHIDTVNSKVRVVEYFTIYNSKVGRRIRPYYLITIEDSVKILLDQLTGNMVKL